TRTAGQTSRDPAVFADRVKLARVTKNDLAIVRRWKTKKTGGIRQRLPRSREDRKQRGNLDKKKNSRAHKCRLKTEVRKLVVTALKCKTRIRFPFLLLAFLLLTFLTRR